MQSCSSVSLDLIGAVNIDFLLKFGLLLKKLMKSKSCIWLLLFIFNHNLTNGLVCDCCYAPTIKSCSTYSLPGSLHHHVFMFLLGCWYECRQFLRLLLEEDKEIFECRWCCCGCPKFSVLNLVFVVWTMHW